MKGFTPEELAELAAFDAKVDAEFELTLHELSESRKRDLDATLERKDRKSRYRAEYRRAYREANKDSIAEKQRAYYEANKDSIAEYQRAYREANKDSIAEDQRAIKDARKARGYTQLMLAKLLGIAQSTLSHWETGAVPANWPLLVGVLPELKEAAR